LLIAYIIYKKKTSKIDNISNLKSNLLLHYIFHKKILNINIFIYNFKRFACFVHQLLLLLSYLQFHRLLPSFEQCEQVQIIP